MSDNSRLLQKRSEKRLMTELDGDFWLLNNSLLLVNKKKRGYFRV